MAKSKKNQPELKPTEAEPKPLKIEINFPNIFDLKQAIAFDTNGRLLVAIQFKAPVVSSEVFRLVNLLTQPNQGLFATVGSKQATMDFLFNPKEDKVEIIRAVKQLAVATSKDEPPAEPKPEGTLVELFGAKIDQNIDPYSIGAKYQNGTGEILANVGSGKSPMDAALNLARTLNLVPADRPVEPFKAIEYLKKVEGNPFIAALVAVIETNTFEPLKALPNYGDKVKELKLLEPVVEKKPRSRKAKKDTEEAAGT